MICGKVYHPSPLVLFYCELEEGHLGEHQASTVAAGEFVNWADESIADKIADLAKIGRGGV